MKTPAAPSPKPWSSIPIAFGLRSSWRRRLQNEEPGCRRGNCAPYRAHLVQSSRSRTWLQQDTQILRAARILEHLHGSRSTPARRILVESPQVSFTLYDEIARGLRAITGLGFREVLEGQQIVTRALGIWGLYLMATALGLSAPASLLVAGIISLGATIGGPAVLSFEIEPDPRGLADAPPLFLAIGLIAHGWDLAAGLIAAAACARAPAHGVPVLGRIPVSDVVQRHRLTALVPLFCALIVLWIAARHQENITRRPGALLTAFAGHRKPAAHAHPVFLDLGMVAGLAAALPRSVRRIRTCLRAPGPARAAICASSCSLPLVRMLSVLASWVLLEQSQRKWAATASIPAYASAALRHGHCAVLGGSGGHPGRAIAALSRSLRVARAGLPDSSERQRSLDAFLAARPC